MKLNFPYTPVPNWFWELYPHLSEPERGILLYIFRETLGWEQSGERRDQADLSYKAIMDHTGIGSKASVAKALRGLQAWGLISSSGARKRVQRISLTDPKMILDDLEQQAKNEMVVHLVNHQKIGSTPSEPPKFPSDDLEQQAKSDLVVHLVYPEVHLVNHQKIGSTPSEPPKFPSVLPKSQEAEPEAENPAPKENMLKKTINTKKKNKQTNMFVVAKNTFSNQPEEATIKIGDNKLDISRLIAYIQEQPNITNPIGLLTKLIKDGKQYYPAHEAHRRAEEAAEAKKRAEWAAFASKKPAEPEPEEAEADEASDPLSYHKISDEEFLDQMKTSGRLTAYEAALEASQRHLAERLAWEVINEILAARKGGDEPEESRVAGPVA